VNIAGLREYEEHQELLDEILNRQTGSRGGGHAPNTHFRYIEEADIVVHSSIYDWLCADLSYTGGAGGPGPTPRPIAGVTFRAFLVRLQSLSEEQQSLIEFGVNGEVTFRIGKAQHDGEPIPVVHLCFPPRPVSVEESSPDVVDSARSVWCSCKKGACNNRRCVCFKSGLECGAKCHGGVNKKNANCVNKPADAVRDAAHHGDASPAAQPAPPAGMLHACKCTSRAQSIPKDLGEWCDIFHRKFAVLRHDPLLHFGKHLVRVWREKKWRFPVLRPLVRIFIANRRTVKRELEERVGRARESWRRARTMRILSNSVSNQRVATFYCKWYLRCCVEKYVGFHIPSSPLRLRYELSQRDWVAA
jgi:hypothetical protein